MKKTIIVILIITALCPIKMMGQLVLNSTFSTKDTVLNVSLENVSDKNNIGLLCAKGDFEDSNVELYFLDSKDKIITNSSYGFFVNGILSHFIQIKPKQKLDFRFAFTSVKKYYNLKKIRVKIYLKYSIEKDKEPLIEKDIVKEFSLE
jgi:hypothetical protein